MFGPNIHKKIFLVGTIALVSSLALSPFIVSLCQFLLGVNWLIEENPANKFRRLLARKGLLFLLAIYLVHVVWMINTSHFAYGWHDLKIKLPIFILPLIFGTSKPFTEKELSYILHFYLISAALAILISTVIFLGITPVKVTDIRDVSPIISHIRLSLIIVLAFYIVLYYLFFKTEKLLFHKSIYYILIAEYLSFTIIIGATTGLAILLLVFPFALLYWLKQKQNQRNVMLGITILFVIPGLSLAYLAHCYYRYMQRDNPNPKSIPALTVNGNKYMNNTHAREYENSHLVWIQVCDKELEKEWNKRSKINYKDRDLKGQPIRSTLIRYMTSYGYTKDSLGMSELTANDINLIENGTTNYIFKNSWNFYPRVYQIFWEIEHYLKGGNPSGHSLTQRIEYIKNSLHVIENHFWFGTGTGDTNYEIQQQYIIDKSRINPHWRNRTHNQIITFFLTFGLVGFTIIITSMVLALRFERRNIDFLFLCFFLIFLFSTINEDTLETQIGATFYAIFISILLLSRNLHPDNT